MLTELAAAASGVVIAVLWREYVVMVALGIWLVVPGIALSSEYTASLRPHPAAMCAIAGFIVVALADVRKLRRRLVETPLVPAALAVVVVVSVVCSWRGFHRLGLAEETDVILAPILMYVTVIISNNSDFFLRARSMLIVGAAAEAALGLAQTAAHSPLVYKASFQGQPWYATFTARGFRAMGTLDHPLNLSLLLVAALALLASSRVRTQLLLAPLLFAGLVATQSRAGLLLGMAAAATLSFRRGAFPMRRAAGVAAAAMTAYLLLGTALGSEALARFSSDPTSTNARTEAAGLATSVISEQPLTGGGLGSSFTFSRDLGLPASLENPYLMLTLDIGALSASLYFLVILASAARRQGHPGTRAAVVLGTLSALTYSSVAVRSDAPPILWFLAALAWGAQLGAQQSRTPAAIKDQRSTSQEHGRRLTLVARDGEARSWT